MDKEFGWGFQALSEMDRVTNIASRVKARKIQRDRGRKRKRNKDSDYVVLSSSEDTEAKSSASERTVSDTETESNMVRRRNERQKRRYQPSSSRRLDLASEKKPSGSYHMERRGSGSHFSMESEDSLYGRRETGAAGGSSRGRRRGIPVDNGIEYVSNTAASESLSKSAGAANPQTDLDFLVWKKLFGKGLGLQTSSDDQTQNQEEKEEEEVQHLLDQRHIFRGWDTSDMETNLVGENVDEAFRRSSPKPQKTHGRPRNAPIQKAIEEEKEEEDVQFFSDQRRIFRGWDPNDTGIELVGENVDESFRRSSPKPQKTHGGPRKAPVQKAIEEEKEEEEVQVLSDQRHIFRGWDPSDTGIELVGENVDESFRRSLAKPQKKRGRPRKAPVKKAMESEIPRPPPLRSDHDHVESSSSETDHDDEDYRLGLSENDESEISLSDEDGISGDTAVDKDGYTEDVVGKSRASKRLKKTSSHCVKLADVEDLLLKAIFGTKGSAAVDGNAAADDIIPEDVTANERVEETIPPDAATDVGNAQVESVQEQIVTKGCAQESITAADDTFREEVMTELNAEGADATVETIPEQVITEEGTVDAAETPGEEVMMDARDEEPNTPAENIANGRAKNIAKGVAKDIYDEPLRYTVEPPKKSGKAILNTNGDKEKDIPVKLEPERQSHGAKRGKASDGTRKITSAASSRKKPHQPRNIQEPVLVAERNINASGSGPLETSKIHESSSIPQDQPSGMSADPEMENGKEATGGDGTKEHSNKQKIPVPTQKKLVTVLIESILGDGSDLEDEDQQEPVVELASWNSSTLPLKFRFEDEDPEPVVKTDVELEVEALFEESGLNDGKFGNESYYKEEESKEETAAAAEQKKTPCEHELYIDYSIGLICRHCFYIAKHIKDIDPEFITEHAHSKRCGARDRISMLDGLNFTPEEVQLGAAFRAENGTVWDAIPGAKAKMYEHQQEGFEFMWKNLQGTTELAELKNSEDSDIGGCIISHAPGTGKTLLTLMFINAYLKIFPNSRPMIIAPASMLLTWEEEFKKWNMDFPFHNLGHFEFTGKEKKILDTHVSTGRSMDKDVIRLIKIYSWTKERSVLGISYNLFENLVGGEYKKVRKTRKVEPKHKSKVGQQSHKYKRMLLDMPRLVIMDEGHTPRNSNSCIWNTILKLQTKRKIILTGTPFQNNFSELFNTLHLVRPEIADSLSKERTYAPMLAAKVGKYAQKKKVETLEATKQHSVDNAIEKLKDIISPFVHVHKGHILRRSLPGLKDSVLLLKPPPLQKQLIKLIEGIRAASSFDYEYKVALLSTHPCLAVHCSLDARERAAINMDEVVSLKEDYKEGVKTRFVIELVRLSVAMNEKVLVFSQYQQVHKLLSEQIRSVFKWEEGRQVIQMHGKQDQKNRQHIITKFNDPKSEAIVLLASTKCCSEGINLVGASRVVLLDVVWNPSVERQAISRAYRLGQQKVVHTYHLMAGGTSEGDKYCRQVEKDRLSELVFSSTTKENVTEQDPTIATDSASASSSTIDDAILHHMMEDENFKDMVEKIIYQPKEVNLIESFTLASTDQE